MKAFKIFFVVLLMGALQANATGFAYNMNQAQKMLKTKKEVVLIKSTTKSVARTTGNVRAEKSERKVQETEAVEHSSASFKEMEEPLTDKVVSTFTQWLSQVFVRVLSMGLGR